MSCIQDIEILLALYKGQGDIAYPVLYTGQGDVAFPAYRKTVESPTVGDAAFIG